jgi:hypothetical protein
MHILIVIIALALLPQALGIGLALVITVYELLTSIKFWLVIGSIIAAIYGLVFFIDAINLLPRYGQEILCFVGVFCPVSYLAIKHNLKRFKTRSNNQKLVS